MDSSSAHNDGTPTGTPSVGAGFIGGGRGMTGSQAFTASGVNFTNEAFTLEIWANVSSLSGDNMWFGGGTTSTDKGLHCGFRGANVVFNLYGDDLSSTSTYSSDQGTWHAYAMVMNGSHVKSIYRDGVSVATPGGSGFYQSIGLVIGGTYGGTVSFKGSMDEVRASPGIVRSANWIWAEYLNIASNGVFNSYGAAGQNNPNLPQISDVRSANLLSTSADVVGTLVTNGAAGQATVYLYWSTTDGSTNASTWTTAGSVSNLGSFADGTTFTNTLTGLASGTTYYWNYSAVNASGTVWGATAGSPSFMTLGTPSVNNGSGATGVNQHGATLNGNLTAGGSAHVYLLLGLQNGIWSMTNDLNTLSQGAFSSMLSSLAPATTYYYTSYATNAYGSAQATPSTNFTTWASQTYVFTNNNQNWTVPANWNPANNAPPRSGDSGIVSNVIALANGNLYTVGVDTPPASIWVRTTNASLQLVNGVTLAEHNIVLDGGTLAENADSGIAANSGTLKINSSSSLGLSSINSSLTLNGPIQDNGASTGLLATKDNNSGYTFTGYILATNNTWTGGLKVGGRSVVYAGAPGCLGTGPIMVTNGLLVTATASPGGPAGIPQVAVTNVFGCSTVTVCGASATCKQYNNGELEMLGDSPNATYLLNSGGILEMHTNLVGGTLILNGGILGAIDYGPNATAFWGTYYDYWGLPGTFYGPIRVRSNSYLGSGAGRETVSLAGQIQDDGGNTGTLITLPPQVNGYQQTINLYNTNSTWTGGVRCRLQLPGCRRGRHQQRHHPRKRGGARILPTERALRGGERVVVYGGAQWVPDYCQQQCGRKRSHRVGVRRDGQVPEREFQRQHARLLQRHRLHAG